MSFLLGFFVGPAVEKVAVVINNAGGMLTGNKERTKRIEDLIRRLREIQKLLGHKSNDTSVSSTQSVV